MGSIESAEQLLAEVQSRLTQVTAEAKRMSNPYYVQYATFTPSENVVPYAPGRQPVKVAGEYIQNDEGKIMFRNGVIADPTTGDVWYPPVHSSQDPETVPGSPQWLDKIQEEWTDEKIAGWRKSLAEQGYQVAESGGMAHDLLSALSQYHQTRYMNFGRVQPKSPGGLRAGEPRLKDVVDPVALREEVKSWGQVPFEEDLDEATAGYFADRVMQTARRLIQDKGWDAARAYEGAGLRVQKEFVNAPGVKGALKDAEDDEMDETLRDSIVSIAQIASV